MNLLKSIQEEKLNSTRHNRITCPETLHSADKNLHIAVLKAVQDEYCTCVWEANENVLREDICRGLDRITSAIPSLQGGRKGSALIHFCHYPNTQERVPTNKTLLQSFGGSSTALFLSPLGRAIQASLYHGRPHHGGITLEAKEKLNPKVLSIDISFIDRRTS